MEDTHVSAITKEHVKSIVCGADIVLDLLNNTNIDKFHYRIVFNFVVNQLLCWCNKVNCPNELNIISVDGLFNVLNKCKYKKECMEFHFLEQKQNNKQIILKNLRSKM